MFHLFRGLASRQTFSSLVATVRRFPLSVAFCIASAALSIAMAHADDPSRYVNAALAISLGLPMSFAVALFAESRRLSRSRTRLIVGGVLVFLVTYFCFLSVSSGSDEIRPFYLGVRHVLLYVATLSFIPLAPFILHPDRRAAGQSWTLVYSLFRSFVLAVFWGGALFVGIAAALLSINLLFVHLSERWILDAWILLATIFSPVFFLARVPSPVVGAVTDVGSFPKELRLFAQYALFPLTAGYFVILYSYAVRIAWLGVWPEGQLAYLIMGASGVGMLAYAALYPLRDQVAWIRRVGTALLALMIPLSILLFWPIGIRVSEYGITENRYLVCAFGLWVLVSNVYLLASKTKDIRALPAILCAIVFISSIGPWSAFSVSERSQTNRLANILWAHGLLVDGTLVDATIESTPSEFDEVESILTYLDRMHGGESLRVWYDGPQTDEAGVELSPADAVRLAYQSSAGVFDEEHDSVTRESRRFMLMAQDPVGDVVDTRGLANFVRVDLNVNNPIDNPEANMTVGGVPYRWAIGEDGKTIELYERDARIASFSAYAFLRANVGTDPDERFQRQISFEDSIFSFSTDRLDAVIVYDRVEGVIENGDVMTDRVEAGIFFTIR